jgi:male-specific lethal 2
MNATNLYVSTCRLVMQANAEDHSSWADLYRLVPYLRQSLSCTVCGNLLIEPYTPTETNCQHHVCKSCKGGKKKLKPSCSWCKDYEKYVENVQLRILLQCYKKLCEYIISSAIYKKLSNVNTATGNSVSTNLLDGTTPSLTSLIQEGAGFADEFRSSRSSNFMLPCVQTNSTSTQTNSASTSTQTNSASSGGMISENTSIALPSNGEVEIVKPVHNGSTVYSVLYAGSGNKLTIKRKASESVSDNHENASLSPVKDLSPPPKPVMVR